MARLRALLPWLLPLVLFGGLLGFMASQLGRETTTIVHSRMVGQPLPDFALEGPGERPGLRTADLGRGQPVLVNLFASWCLPCAVEAPQLEALSREGIVIHGIAVRDAPERVAAFLDRHGDPFDRIGLDSDGRMMLTLGASGVPETYVVDGRGVIRHQHIGEIRPEHLPVLRRALEAAR